MMPKIMASLVSTNTDEFHEGSDDVNKPLIL